MADLVGDDLIDGDAGVNVGAGCFLNAHAGEKSAAGPGMIARAIRTRSGVDMVHTAQDLQLILQLRQWLHCWRELEILRFAFGPPIRLDRAIREIDERHAQRSAAGSSGEFGRTGLSGQRAQGADGFKCGQRQTSAQAAQKAPAVEAGKVLDGKVRVLLHSAISLPPVVQTLERRPALKECCGASGMGPSR